MSKSTATTKRGTAPSSALLVVRRNESGGFQRYPTRNEQVEATMEKGYGPFFAVFSDFAL